MKKLMILMAMVLMVAVAAIPAFAQSFELDQDATSGDIVQTYDSSVYGYGNAVATDADFFANTGNSQNQEVYSLNGVIQYDN